MSKEELGYKDALARIEEIVGLIEEESDIDSLTQLVGEASNLIQVCKDKLKNAETDLQKSLEKLG